MRQLSRWILDMRQVLVHQSILKASRSASKESQLGVRIETAVTNPTSQKEILARDPESSRGRIPVQQRLPDLLRERRFHFLVGVERQNPVPARLLKCGVLLRGETLPAARQRILRGTDSAISRVRSVDPESSTTISSAHATLASVRARFASSFSVMMTTERLKHPC